MYFVFSCQTLSDKWTIRSHLTFWKLSYLLDSEGFSSLFQSCPETVLQLLSLFTCSLELYKEPAASFPPYLHTLASSLAENPGWENCKMEGKEDNGVSCRAPKSSPVFTSLPVQLPGKNECEKILHELQAALC